MLCDGCSIDAKGLFWCSNDHVLCEECTLLLIDRQCPICSVPIHKLKEPMQVKSLDNTPKLQLPISDKKNKMQYTVDELRQKCREKYLLNSPRTDYDHTVSQNTASAQTAEAANQNECQIRLEQSRFNEEYHRSEMLLKEEMYAKLGEKTEKRFKKKTTNEVEFPKFFCCNETEGAGGFNEIVSNFKQEIPSNIDRKSKNSCTKSSPRPIPVLPKTDHSIKSHQSNPQPDLNAFRTVYTPANIVPDRNLNMNRFHQHPVGYGDAARLTETGNNNELIDIPPEQFAQFMKEKFQNMSLKDITSYLSKLPNFDLKQAVPTGITEPKFENTQESQLHVSYNQPLVASRAAVIPGRLAFGQPVMQSTLIQPFDAEEFKIINEELPSIMEATQINIPRNPLKCPISSCSNSTVFVSDFTKHIKINHVRVPVEVLNPKCGCNLFIDPALDEVNHNRCKMLYLVTDKIRDLGSTLCKDYLPVLVMTSRLSLDQLFPQSPTTSTCSDESCLIVWLTGILPTQTTIHVTLTVWRRPHKNQPMLHRVHSGVLYCIRKSQNPVDVYRSGHALVLTTKQCISATIGGKKLLKMQVIVH